MEENSEVLILNRAPDYWVTSTDSSSATPIKRFQPGNLTPYSLFVRRVQPRGGSNAEPTRFTMTTEHLRSLMDNKDTARDHSTLQIPFNLCFTWGSNAGQQRQWTTAGFTGRSTKSLIDYLSAQAVDPAANFGYVLACDLANVPNGADVTSLADLVGWQSQVTEQHDDVIMTEPGSLPGSAPVNGSPGTWPRYPNTLVYQTGVPTIDSDPNARRSVGFTQHSNRSEGPPSGATSWNPQTGEWGQEQPIPSTDSMHCTLRVLSATPLLKAPSRGQVFEHPTRTSGPVDLCIYRDCVTCLCIGGRE